MGYEYGSKGFRLANPFRLHGIVSLATAALALFLGILLLFSVQDAVVRGDPAIGWAKTLFAAILLGVALSSGARGIMGITRIYMGRNAPSDLGAHGHVGLRDALNNRINPDIEEPRGPLARAIMGVFDQLMFVPMPIRHTALRAAQLFLRSGLLAGLLLLALFATSTRLVPLSDVQWNWFLGIAAFGQFLNLLGWSGRQGDPKAVTVADQGTGFIVTTIIMALVAPSAVLALSESMGRDLPDLPIDFAFWFWGLTLGSMLSAAAVFAGTLVRAVSVDQTADTAERGRQRSSNRIPADLMRLFDQIVSVNRLLDIPNRVYERSDPVLRRESSETRGAFQGSRLIETQPDPLSDQTPNAVRLWCAAAAVIGGALKVIGLLMLFVVGFRLSLADPVVLANALARTAVFWMFGSAFWGASMLLRGELRYRSRLVLFDVEGSFQDAKIVAGKGLHDSVMSENTVLKAEITENLCCAVLMSSNFIGTTAGSFQNPRYILGFQPDYALVDQIVSGLADYEENVEHLVGFKSKADVETLMQFQQLNTQTTDGAKALETGQNETVGRLNSGG